MLLVFLGWLASWPAIGLSCGAEVFALDIMKQDFSTKIFLLPAMLIGSIDLFHD